VAEVGGTVKTFFPLPGEESLSGGQTRRGQRDLRGVHRRAWRER
jgi:hypothetical protein